ncbi:hypothetical protein ACH3XW_43625 [Acanthocheilonema viteae]
MDYYSLKWIFFILLPEVTQSLIKTLPGVTFEQLNGKGKMWIGPPIPPPFCFPPSQMPRAPAVPEATQTSTSAPSGKAPEQSPSAAVPVMSYPFQAKTWWCPSMYQQQTPMPPLQYSQIPQYPQYLQTVHLPLPPQYQQIIQPPLPQYQQSLPQYQQPLPQYQQPPPQYQQIAQLSPQYPQQPINGAGMVGSSLYGMIGEDSDSTLKAYDHFQMIFA